MIALMALTAMLAVLVALDRRTAAARWRQAELAAAVKRTRPRWRADRYTLHPLPPGTRVPRLGATDVAMVAWLLWGLSRRRRTDD